MAKQERAIDTVEEDAAELKRQRKAAKKAAKETAAAQADVPAGLEAVPATTEVNEDEAKKQRKAAKKAAKEAAAAQSDVPADLEAMPATTAVDEDEAKKQRKAAKKAAKAAAAAEGVAPVEELGEDEAKRLRKAAKKAAREAALAPPENGSKRALEKGESQKEEVPKTKKSRTELQREANEGGNGDDDELSVFVRNLPWSVNGEMLHRDFSECGTIDWIKMPKNEEGKPRGFAFVKFKTQSGVDACLKFNDTSYGGRTIFVEQAGNNTRGGGKDGSGKGGKGGKAGTGDRNNPLTVCIKGLPYNCDDKTLNKDFAECGEIAKMKVLRNEEGESRGMAFVTFKTQDGFDAALKFHDTEYGGRFITVDKPTLPGEGGKGKGKDAKDGKGKGKDGKSKGKDSKGKKGKGDKSNGKHDSMSSEPKAAQSNEVAASTVESKAAASSDEDDE